MDVLTVSSSLKFLQGGAARLANCEGERATYLDDLTLSHSQTLQST